MKILHHNDNDGRLAAAIVLKTHPEAECIEMSYASRLPLERIGDEEVVVVDFSLQQEGDWKRLYDKCCGNITWIDHHETAIQKAKTILLSGYLSVELFVDDLLGKRSTSACGASLTWQYFMPEPEVSNPPAVIDLIDRWDRGVHNDEPDILNFQAGSKMYNLRATSPLWQTMLNDGVLADATIREIQITGETVGRYQAMQDIEAINRFAYPLEWEGHLCAVLYCDRAGSRLFESLKFDSSALGRADVYISVNFDGKKYTVHLYSETVKVNDIAVKHGGGGHPGAAGFVCDVLPWVTPLITIKGDLTPELRKEIQRVLGQ